jgi:hypothetical protein
MSRLWLAIEPTYASTRLLLSQPVIGTLLKAKLPPMPAHPKAVAMLLEALAAWSGEPLCAVVDADAEEVQRRGEHWARFLGELDGERISVEWVCPPIGRTPRDRFMRAMGDFRSARQLLTYAAVGQR